ncbi:ABC transporter ATP-binding protein [Ovoidimarina sediminis]|uniref:ABC transporter ATP-binding protein n=1 Tax=Ovoidimarina sediminis TaxID=3079856 RepID=UPI00290ED78B|nr:ABC transporter ATP-binding protein [Rhodophyticola sp. MJ-SS7]MDU8945220.1 ABC transporter ATP-binding protein [Rhodophyticola sp. MJ-SS7]
MLLDVRSLKKSFPGDDGPVPVLDSVSLTIDSGESVALTGESGSGKSTLLHVVAGLEPADEGAVLIDGTDIAAMGDVGRARLRRTRLGIVFQQFNLIPSLDVRANVAFQARLAGRYEQSRVETLLYDLGLGDHASKYPEQLSGGQQQRVAIGRALAGAPDLLLADEPTGNLDETTGDAVIGLMLDLAKDAGTSLLMVTHSERLAGHLDRRLHLSLGRLH